MRRKMDNNKKYRDAVKFMFFVPLIIGLIFGISALVMWLWNTILPDLIGVNQVGYWHAMGLLLLSKILFGGLGSGNKFNSEKKATEKMKSEENQYKQLDDMSNEELRKFKEELDRRCELLPYK
ncbi:hypothetical protein [Flavobacterium litorale]|uniref:Uncharacterized protein n=1 Tax=Flavobacterium litorale TaxID=2856519 RepID=A0ABX8V8M7_9FLAO|nr:hypothetical protein [Flavobacterium litorale]QYJ67386.1 hypothetical protein K1I41_07360 [Flavobacterium litorale]